MWQLLLLPSTVDLTVTALVFLSWNLAKSAPRSRVGSWDRHILGAMTGMQASNQNSLILVRRQAQECGRVVETMAVLMGLAGLHSAEL